MVCFNILKSKVLVHWIDPTARFGRGVYKHKFALIGKSSNVVRFPKMSVWKDISWFHGMMHSTYFKIWKKVQLGGTRTDCLKDYALWSMLKFFEIGKGPSTTTALGRINLYWCKKMCQGISFSNFVVLTKYWIIWLFTLKLLNEIPQ